VSAQGQIGRANIKRDSPVQTRGVVRHPVFVAELRCHPIFAGRNASPGRDE
jgi:hypothetical protein